VHELLNNIGSKEKLFSLKWKLYSVVAAMFLFSSYIEHRNMSAMCKLSDKGMNLT
jgi:hypothetical protein